MAILLNYLRNMLAFFIYTGAGDKFPAMMNTFMVFFFISIEFHRKATVINYCECNKIENIKRRLLLYIYYNVICYNVTSYGLIFHNCVLSLKSLLARICASIMEKYQYVLEFCKEGVSQISLAIFTSEYFTIS